MKVQMTGSYPCIPGTLPALAAVRDPVSPPAVNPAVIALDSPPTAAQTAALFANIARMPKVWPLPTPPPAPLDLSFLQRAPKVHVFSPAVASSSPSREKILGGLRAFSDLITPHCGQKVAIGASVIWLAVDGVSARQTFRDPDSRPSERVSAASTVGSDLAGLCGGILGAPYLNQAATALNFAAVVGDHVHTGQITFSQSELAQFSSDPQADDVSNILKLTEVLQPTNP